MSYQIWSWIGWHHSAGSWSGGIKMWLLFVWIWLNVNKVLGLGLNIDWIVIKSGDQFELRWKQTRFFFLLCQSIKFCRSELDSRMIWKCASRFLKGKWERHVIIPWKEWYCLPWLIKAKAESLTNITNDSVGWKESNKQTPEPARISVNWGHRLLGNRRRAPIVGKSERWKTHVGGRWTEISPKGAIKQGQVRTRASKYQKGNNSSLFGNYFI